MFIRLNFSYDVQCVIAPDISPRNRGVRVPAGTQMDSANRCLAKLNVSKRQVNRCCLHLSVPVCFSFA